jgi:hypothetical protein
MSRKNSASTGVEIVLEIQPTVVSLLWNSPGDGVVEFERAASETGCFRGKIRLPAYELYEERGMEDGHEQEEWFRAKEEITIKKFRTATA